MTCYFLPIALTIRPKGISHPVGDLAELAARLFDERDLTPIPRPRIVISDQIAPAARARLADEADIVDVAGTALDLALHAALADADALVVRSETIVDEAALAAAPTAQVVARAGVGVDTIDVVAATRAGVLVLNAQGERRVGR